MKSGINKFIFKLLYSCCGYLLKTRHTFFVEPEGFLKFIKLKAMAKKV